MNDEDLDWWFNAARKVGHSVTVRSVRRSLGTEFDEADVKAGLDSVVAAGRAIALAGDGARAPTQYLLLDGGPLLPRGDRSAER